MGPGITQLAFSSQAFSDWNLRSGWNLLICGAAVLRVIGETNTEAYCRTRQKISFEVVGHHAADCQRHRSERRSEHHC